MDDRLIHLVSGDPHRTRVDDTAQADHGDVGRAAADIDDHVSVWLRDRQAGADGRRHRFFDEIDLRSFCTIRGVFDSASFHLSNFRRNPDHNTRAHPRLSIVGLADEVLKHLLRDFKVGDDTILHRANRNDVAGRTAQHVFRISPNSFDLIGYFINCNDRGF